MNQSLIFIGCDPGVKDAISLFELHPDGRLTILSDHPNNETIEGKIEAWKEVYRNIKIDSWTNDFKKWNHIIDGECEDITNKRALPEMED